MRRPSDRAQQACIVGIGQTQFTKWGGITERSEFQLACEAVIAAAEDAGLSCPDIDGFASYANDANESSIMQVALGSKQVRFASIAWGGGGACAAVAHAAAAVSTGLAGRNPNAVMRERPLTLERYFSSRMIADPLRLYDCCLESDGACAVIVTTLERAADLAGVAVPILAAGQGSEAGWGTGALGGFNMPADVYCSANSRTLARELYARAGVGPSEINVAQLYDDFTGMVLMSLEDFGFCAAGEGGPFAAAGRIGWPDGSLPINTSGGNLAEAYIHGFNLVLEGVRQMRGASTSQVTDAQTCLVTGGPAVGPTSALILAKVF